MNSEFRINKKKNTLQSSKFTLIKMAKSIFKSRVREYKGENIQKLQVNITKNLQCNCKIKDVEIKINYIHKYTYLHIRRCMILQHHCSTKFRFS